MNIPVLVAVGNSLAETYEKGLIELYKNGTRIKTQYDKPEDPASIDATVNLTILNPWSDPMIHKFFPGGIEDLREYVYELEGLKDCICRNENDPKDTRWEYLYSSRMTNYGTWIEKINKLEMNGPHGSHFTVGKDFDKVSEYEDGKISVRMGHFNINQVEKVIEKLVKQPYTRQAQMITWMPNMDLDVYDPPCYQSAWFRMIQDEKGKYWLNTNIRFRSNDASRAFAMNAFGFIQFIHDKILIPLQERMNQEIGFGRINWQADSWHIYGSEIKNFHDRFYSRLNLTKFEDRVYNFFDSDIQKMYHECETEIINKFNDIKKSFKIIS